MKRVLYILLVFLMTTQFVSAEEPIRERIEWADIWVTNANKDDKMDMDIESMDMEAEPLPASPVEEQGKEKETL